MRCTGGFDVAARRLARESIAGLDTARYAVEQVLHCPKDDFLTCPHLRTALEGQGCAAQAGHEPLASPIPHCGDCAE